MRIQNRRTIENETKRIYKNCTKDMEDIVNGISYLKLESQRKQSKNRRDEFI